MSLRPRRPAGALWSNADFLRLWSAQTISQVGSLREGLRYVFRQPYLRILTMTTGASNFFTTMLFSLFILYAVRELGFSPGTIGAVFMLVNLGALAGAVLSSRIVRAFGLGPTIVWSAIAGNLRCCRSPSRRRRARCPSLPRARCWVPGSACCST